MKDSSGLFTEQGLNDIQWLRFKYIYFSALFVLLLLISSCATPIGVIRGSTQEMHYALTANVLSAGEPSAWSKQVLHRTNLGERFDEDTAATLGILHKMLGRLSEDILQGRW